METLQVISHATETSESVIDSQIEQDLMLLRHSIQIPFLPQQKEKKYTLVLDLDETLIHLKEIEGEEGSFCYFRPGSNKFLQELS